MKQIKEEQDAQIAIEKSLLTETEAKMTAKEQLHNQILQTKDE